MSNDFDDVFLSVQQLIAHPHKTITEHDKHRALVLIVYLSDNDDLVKYLLSKMTSHDYQKVNNIRKDVLNSIVNK